MFDNASVGCAISCVSKPRRKELSPKARKNIPRAPFTSRSIPNPLSSRITFDASSLALTTPSQLRVLLVYASLTSITSAPRFPRWNQLSSRFPLAQRPRRGAQHRRRSPIFTNLRSITTDYVRLWKNTTTGEDEVRNLQLLCSYCNRAKATRGSHGFRMKMAELRAHNIVEGMMVDARLAVLTGRRLSQYHREVATAPTSAGSAPRTSRLRS